MFEATATPPESATGAPAGPLDASNLEAWQDSLSAALDLPSGLEDDGRIDALRALEKLGCVVTAAQAALARELDVSQRARQAAAGEPAPRQGRGVAAQLAFARRESHHRGRQHLGLAKAVATELPHTWAAWRAGRIGEWKATLVARETACLPVQHRLEVDRLVASDADALEAMGDAALAAAVAREAARLDAASVTRRRRKAETERRVTLRPAPDTMAYLTALLPVKDGVAVLAALTAAAATSRAVGDERSKGQVMADTLVSSVLAGVSPRSPTTWKSEKAQDSTPAPAPRVELGLVMTDQALFGTADDPAHLAGFGPIPAELAREIVAGACDRDDRVWLRRLYACPTTGRLVAMEAQGRFFGGSLATFIRLRDQTCRNPWCDAPIRHHDHLRRRADGGATRDDNAQGLCEACNYAKDAPDWRARPGPDGTVETTTPTGHSYTTRPPDIAPNRGRQVLRLAADYILTG